MAEFPRNPNSASRGAEAISPPITGGSRLAFPSLSSAADDPIYDTDRRESPSQGRCDRARGARLTFAATGQLARTVRDSLHRGRSDSEARRSSMPPRLILSPAIVLQAPMIRGKNPYSVIDARCCWFGPIHRPQRRPMDVTSPCGLPTVSALRLAHGDHGPGSSGQATVAPTISLTARATPQLLRA
ncbi:uncharacterized protein BO80DRAFT_79791 [Aspergillus ibericus CBS 121593]|uniref:Uncharacterized protein n=1 Tax=Aspergillus ibericus CBS 121593 TaxID=1448316 RepID=A0A395HE15_9EURO|nr:hypothetical protein BO80DRAFT_79791 [Aspergillus ibericus CBS 121593]RAL05739.1 hypothetical protein BO80DRAFT_79791 [Aspergillus ibericus CBS 121593]